MKYLILLYCLILSVSLPAQATSWNEKNLKEYWKSNNTDAIEGIYVREKIVHHYHRNRHAQGGRYVQEDLYFIVKQGDRYLLDSFKSNIFAINLNGTITKSYDSSKYFLATNINYWVSDQNKNKTLTLKLENGILHIEEFRIQLDTDEYTLVSEVFTPVFKPEPLQSIQKNSGTGFLIASNGIIATNHHLIDGANTIKVRGLNSIFSQEYTAKVLISDKKNDLALIQIDATEFSSYGVIPYSIKTELAAVGENIFVLGYPLRATMGDEIKLTNGIVSSRTGFQGDVTSYQISAPVQAGNSGGPVFDSKGNLIGIINSKHGLAENATYAIKANYLVGLTELLPIDVKLPTFNSLSGKSLPNQVEIIKNFVYIIETE